MFGNPGSTARISYTDVHANPQMIDSASLPWAYEESTTTPGGDRQHHGPERRRLGGLPHHHRRRGQGREVGRRPGAYTYCLDKSG